MIPGIKTLAVLMLMVGYVFAWPQASRAQSLNLKSLTGNDGFEVKSRLTASIVGDINNDGVDDFVTYSRTVGSQRVANARLVYGSTDPSGPVFDENALVDGQFTEFLPIQLNGVAQHSTFAPVGDVNRDDIDDMVVKTACRGYYGRPAGSDELKLVCMDRTYIVFGRSGGLAATLDLNSIRSKTKLSGVAIRLDRWIDFIDDVNGDNNLDYIVRDYIYDNETRLPDSRDCDYGHVFFGNASNLPRTLRIGDLNGSNGFSIPCTEKVTANQITFFTAEYSVFEPIGDVNADGIVDLVVTRYLPFPINYRGVAYVIYGKQGRWPRNFSIDNLTGDDGFAIIGEQVDRKNQGYFASSVSGIGDFNGDGIDDLAVSAPSYPVDDADQAFPRHGGAVYVVFGQQDGFKHPTRVSRLADNAGFKLYGDQSTGRSGETLEGIGDFNADGLDDFVYNAD